MEILNSKYTILVILPHLYDPQRTIGILKNAQFRVLTASTLEEYTHLLKTEHPELVLLSSEYPETDRLGKSTPLLFLNNHSDKTDLSEFLVHSNNDFIISPFNAQELELRIHHQLSLIEARHTILKQNQKLKKTIEARDKLYSIIAHDLRAPIGTIKMINSALQEKKSQIRDIQIRKLVDMISETTEEAFNLLENLLRWSRNQNKSTKVYASIFNLTRSTRQVLSLFSTIASVKGITLHELPEKEILGYADEDMIKTVLRNLISNAIKFTPTGGHITVILSELAKCILVSVKDDGIGIRKEIQPKLLKDNEHVTTYGTHNEKGSGLGLLVSRDFIKMNKGKLWFASKEGAGTTFYFTVPRPPLQ